MRVPNSEHQRRPWLIHELTPDFTLEDVWALPVRGGPEDFQELLDLGLSFDPARAESRATRVLWRIRERLGARSGIFESPAGAPQETLGALPFTPLYRLEREAAAELSNRTVHAIAHLSWVARTGDLYEGRLAIYAKPRGILGRAYMVLIRPFRHRIVYPAMVRQIERAWISGHGS